MAPNIEVEDSRTDQKPIIAVRMLGQFSLSPAQWGSVFTDDYSPIEAAGRAHRIWALIAYLIVHRNRDVSTSELIEVLWTEENRRANPLKTLQHNVSRARDVLVQLHLPDARGLISASQGCYRWNPRVTTVVDYEVFQTLVERADGAPSAEEQLGFLRRAFALYGGDFAPGLASESWLAPISAHVLSLYESHCAPFVRMLLDGGNVSEALAVCERASRLLPASESVCTAYLRALAAAGTPEKACSVYEGTRKMLADRFGAVPSAELDATYEKVITVQMGEAASLEDVYALLSDSAADQLPQKCSLQTFRSMVRREALNRGRASKTAGVVMVGVRSSDGVASVQRLEKVLTHFLRRGDAYTQLGSHQFAVLLPELGEENAKGIVDRLNNHYQETSSSVGDALDIEWLPADAFLA